MLCNFFVKSANGSTKGGNIVPLLIIACLCCFTNIMANSPSNHYIIAFDRALMDRYKPIYTSPQVLDKIEEDLKNLGYRRADDYISVVGYTMEAGNPSIERFVRPYKDANGKDVLWRKNQAPSLRSLFINWPTGQPNHTPLGYPIASMQSLAKPYVVMASVNDSTLRAAQTYMIMVTDEVINGTDNNFQQEWLNVATCQGADYKKFNIIRPNVFNRLLKFNEEFNLIETKGNGGATRVSLDGNTTMSGYKIINYEVVPTERPSIYSVTDFPTPLPLKRIRNGYRLDFDTHVISDKYEIVCISIFNSSKELLGTTSDGKVEILIPGNKIAVGDSLTVTMDLALKDGLYDGFILSSKTPRNAVGLSSTQEVKEQNEAKILGLIPLTDTMWWFFPNDMYNAVIIWDIIIALILIGTILFLGYRILKRIATYIPDDNTITITHL